MRKLLLAGLTALTMTAQAADNDTLTVMRPAKVTVITGDSLQQIRIEGREGDIHYSYSSQIALVDSNYVSSTAINEDSWALGIFNQKVGGSEGRSNVSRTVSTRLGIGLSTAIGADKGLSLSTGSSWEIFWTIGEYDYFRRGSHDGYSIGFGIGWRNYRLSGHDRFVKGGDGTIGLERYPEGYEPDFSRIKVFSLNIPLMWRHRFGRKHSFALGPVVNINTYASIKNRYRDAEGRKHKEVMKHIHQRPVTVDIMAELNVLNGVSVYCKYSPMHLIESDYSKGSRFQAISFGVYL